MHEWHTHTSRNPLNLIFEFENFQFDTDYDDSRQSVSSVKLSNRVFDTEEKARTFVTDQSYGSTSAYMAAYTAKKLSKGYLNAYNNFLEKYNEWVSFRRNLTIGYGRKASKVTCPTCGSSINLKYGGRYKECPVCRSQKIISDSNWKMLDTKKRLCEKAAENVAKEAEKNDVMFMCGIEWHS